MEIPSPDQAAFTRQSPAVSRFVATLLIGLIWGMGCSCCERVSAEGLLDEPLPASWQSDAALNDVCFIDRQTGWAAGDHGTILRTTDGGENWKTIAQLNQTVIANSGSNGNLSLAEKLRGVSNRQVIKSAPTGSAGNSRFTCQLTGIFFLDQQHGWACGGYAVPYLERTQSVVLRTSDGGVSWKVLHNTAAPAFHQIRFTSLRSGWAVGSCGHKFRSGIWFTHDGGNSWSSDAPETPQKSWRRATRRGTNTIAVSSSGGIGFSIGGNPAEMDRAAILSDRRQYFTDVAIVDKKNAWAVGQRGAIFRSTDDGLSFRPAKLEVKEGNDANRQRQTLPLIDFETMAVTKNKIWAAGRPGSCLVSIDRQTSAVAFHKTPVTTGIQRIAFVDDQTGYAVGDLGVILSTVDGGRTWEVRRGRHRKLDVLNICATVADVPLNLLADLACENNLLCGTMLLAANDHLSSGSFALHARQSAGRCGNATWLAVGLPKKIDPAAARMQLLQRMVKHIRQCRPQCVALVGVDEKLVTQAVYAAADTRVLHGAQTDLNLPPWQVKRLAIADPGGGIVLGGDKLLPLEGQTIADRVMISRSLLGLSLREQHRRLTRSWRMVRLIGRGDGGQSTTAIPVREPSLLKGIGQVTGRTRKSRTSTGLAIIERGSQKRQMFQRLLKADIHDGKSISHWQNDLLTLTLSVDRQQAGNWIMELADEYFRSGDPEMTSRTLQLLSTRWSEHAYAPVARLWLATYFASEEFNLKAFFDARAAAIERTKNQSSQSGDLITRATDAGAELTQVQTDHIGNGDRRLSWQAPDPEQLKKQTEAARRSRLQRQGDARLSGDSDLDELVRLAAEVDEQLGANVVTATVPTDLATDARLLKDALQRIRAEFRLDQWLEQRRQLAVKFLNRIKSQDADLAASPTCQLLDLRLSQLSMEPGLRLESLQQRLTRDPNGTPELLQRWIRQEAAVLQSVNDRPVSGQPVTGNGLTHLQRLDRHSVRCVRASVRPKLDGIADDAVWKQAYQFNAIYRLPHARDTKAESQIKLVSFDTPAAGELTDALMFARDDQFLYVLATLSKLQDEKYRPGKGVRTRDPDLIGRDRVEIELDIDRDGQTRFRFAIDYRGWAAEGINGMTDWNPTWFVECQESAKHWTVEAAIPLSAIWGQAEQGAESKFTVDDEVRRAIGAPVCWSIGLRRRRWDHEEFWHVPGIDVSDQSDYTSDYPSDNEGGDVSMMNLLNRTPVRDSLLIFD